MIGFVDFEQDDTARLPDVIKHFNGKPPSTSFFYEFIDGTSVGFWKDEQVNNNDDDTGLFFESTFATCKCRDCSESSPTSDPAFESASPSAKASSKPSCGENEVGCDRDTCLLYTSPSPRDLQGSRMPSSA